MTIRKAVRGDLRAMAEVSAAAFMGEELFGELMHPRRKEYPEDFIVFFERKYLSHWYDPRHHFLVGLDGVSGRVVAVAEWDRQGASTSWSDKMDFGVTSRIVSSYIRASSYIWPNRAADPTKANILAESFPLFSDLWSGSREQNWYLDMLATHPDFQGQGLGNELVKWGLEEARKENVCASVISALGKEGFYGKFGFVERGRSNVGPLKEHGIQGGAVMFRDV
ncbi:hypothetical protein D0Z07_5144 [Hyphodiscus hymeniophilus]|uniref:N-acetyltransferase domain-containing protein n=1 Tax=Hyphodiscus hymeniophilus TaxID=353542 RepID=A0A9P7AWV5_9HELO|nr:hypothetical protein D0Z07_5144 [Hyphodiscus hymeniophilus]